MALACLGEIKSRVKGHHVYEYNYKVNEELKCFLQPDNNNGNNAIVLKSKDVVVGHIPEALAEKLFPLMKRWKLYQIKVTITGEKRRAPEGTWVLGRGIELPCTYYLYGPKIHKCIVRNSLKT